MTKVALKFWLVLLLVVTGSAVVTMPAGAIGATIIPRSIHEAVNRQGTFCFTPPGSAGCFLFDPPVANYIFFQRSDNLWTTAVDYAGLEDRWLREHGANHLGFMTTFSGTVTERPLADGRAEITVELHTDNALARAFVSNPDGSSTPLFGYTPTEVLAGAQPATGSSDFEFLYIAPRVGMPLQDFVVPGFIHPEWFESLHFRAQATGPLRSGFGVPNGTPGRMTVDMISTQTDCCVREVLNLSVV